MTSAITNAMILMLFLGCWFGCSTLLCLAIARMAAQPHPLPPVLAVA